MREHQRVYQLWLSWLAPSPVPAALSKPAPQKRTSVQGEWVTVGLRQEMYRQTASSEHPASHGKEGSEDEGLRGRTKGTHVEKPPLPSTDEESDGLRYANLWNTT